MLDRLAGLFVGRRAPACLRSDHGPEFTARRVREWLGQVGVETLYIEPGSPWENGYVESFNGKRRDELLNREISYTLREAQVLIEAWREDYSRRRPHSALGYRPPAPEAVQVAAGLTRQLVRSPGAGRRRIHLLPEAQGQPRVMEADPC